MAERDFRANSGPLTTHPTLKPRSLVSEILATQLAFAAVVGLIAVVGLWVISNYVLRDNLTKWSARWVSELETLGAGLYIEGDDTGLLALRTYLDRYDELLYIRYYNPDGEPLYVESNGDRIPFKPLPVRAIRELREKAGTDEPQVLDDKESPQVRLSKAIVTESLTGGDLFAAQKLEDLKTETKVIGFVEIGLDFSRYDQDLFGSVLIGSISVVIAFLVLTALGRTVIVRGLLPLSALELPLKRLASGDLDVNVPTSSHSEITAIGNALNAAVASIRERDQHLRKLASYDQLTGLANRRYFLERAQQMFTDHSGAVLFIDLDQFKYVNDTLGHTGGDLVLAQAAQRLRQAVRAGDLIARVGGDEFVMFIQHVDSRRALAIGTQILTDLKEYPLTQDGKTFNVGCSIGISMVEQNSPFTSTEIVSHADLACRQAKSEGRSRACIYEHSGNDLGTIQSEVKWQQRLKQAIKNDEFELHYQPILHVATNSIRHYEALIRLRDGDSLIFPDTFLNAARRFGLMTDIDQWVISRAIAELADLRKTRPEVKFGINLTGSTFIEGGFADFVGKLLDQHRVPATSVIFEITEQVAIGSFSDAVPQIKELVDRGCEFAVDDFGTGYSSLSYLKRLPVQYIKIDGVFIRKLAESEVDQTIVRAVVDIARIMGKKTVAEFVGDEPTFELIRKIGIDYAQGYFIGKPAREIVALSTPQIIELTTRSARSS